MSTRATITCMVRDRRSTVHNDGVVYPFTDQHETATRTVDIETNVNHQGNAYTQGTAPLATATCSAVFGPSAAFVERDWQILGKQMEIAVSRENGKVVPHGDGTNKEIRV